MLHALFFVTEINWFHKHQVALGLLKLEQSAINSKESFLCTAGATKLDGTLYMMLQNVFKN